MKTDYDNLIEKALTDTILKKFGKRKKNGSIVISIDNFLKETLINDLDVLKRALDNLQQSLKNIFEYQFIFRTSISSAADINMAAPLKTPRDVKITVFNADGLLNHSKDLEADLKKSQASKKLYAFNLIDGYLSLKGSKKPPHQMEMGGKRYKVLFFLAKAKKYIKTKDLADKFDATPTSIRRTVGEIRKVVQDAFNVPLNSIIDNNKTAGYRVLNVIAKSSDKVYRVK
ncbi:hypothetical protein KW790_01660 [Candidatus Parcubacteria bacterium]|nr:hypothetical protein [Candidatus Parcubacteria bacterium]